MVNFKSCQNYVIMAQGSVLGPLLFIIVLEVLSRGSRTSCPWEFLYADDLILLGDTMDELLSKLGNWEKHLEAKGLRVSMGKTKIMISGKTCIVSGTQESILVVFVEVLEVIQFFVVGVSYASIKNAMASKVN